MSKYSIVKISDQSSRRIEFAAGPSFVIEGNFLISRESEGFLIVTSEGTYPELITTTFILLDQSVRGNKFSMQTYTKPKDIILPRNGKLTKLTFPSGRTRVFDFIVSTLLQIDDNTFVMCFFKKNRENAQFNLVAVDRNGEQRWRVHFDPNNVPPYSVSYEAIVLTPAGQLIGYSHGDFPHRIDIKTGEISYLEQST